MKSVDVNEKIIEKLREDGLSIKMKSLEFCKFLIIEEMNGEIIGASGIGGLINNHSIIIKNEHRGKGLGLKLFKENIEEAKKRGYNYIISSRNPKNIAIKKLHGLCDFQPLLKINYSPNITSEALILPLSIKGKIIKKILKIFNTKIGLIVLMLTLKSMKSQFENILTIDSKEFEGPNLKYSLINFEKYE